MKLSRNFLAVATLGIFMAGTGAVQAETLQDAVTFMLKSNPDVRSQYYNRMAREKEVRQAKAGYLPTIDASVAAGLDRQHQPFFDTTWPESATISVRQNVSGFSVPSQRWSGRKHVSGLRRICCVAVWKIMPCYQVKYSLMCFGIRNYMILLRII